MKDLKSQEQCVQSVKKAQSVLAMIRRHFKVIDENFMVLYKTYIRPHLEYCVQVWSPHLKKDINNLERIQRTATKLVKGLKWKSHEERLKILGLHSLQQQRIRGDLIETYKILTGKERVDNQRFFRLATNSHGLRGHQLKLFMPRCSTTARRTFFSSRVIGTLALDVSLGGGVNASTTFGGTAPLKFGMAKNVQNLVRFTTTFEFDRKYL